MAFQMLQNWTLPSVASLTPGSTAMTDTQNLILQQRAASLANKAASIKNAYLAPMLQSKIDQTHSAIQAQQAGIPLTHARTAQEVETTHLQPLLAAIAKQNALTKVGSANQQFSDLNMGIKKLRAMRSLTQAQKSQIAAKHPAALGRLESTVYGAHPDQQISQIPNILNPQVPQQVPLLPQQVQQQQPATALAETLFPNYNQTQAQVAPQTQQPQQAPAQPPQDEYTSAKNLASIAQTGRGGLSKLSTTQIRNARVYSRSARNILNERLAPLLNSVKGYASFGGHIERYLNEAKATAGMDTSPDYQNFVKFSTTLPIFMGEAMKSLQVPYTQESAKEFREMTNPLWIRNNGALAIKKMKAISDALDTQERTVATPAGDVRQQLGKGGAAYQQAVESGAQGAAYSQADINHAANLRGGAAKGWTTTRVIQELKAHNQRIAPGVR